MDDILETLYAIRRLPQYRSCHERKNKNMNKVPFDPALRLARALKCDITELLDEIKKVLDKRKEILYYCFRIILILKQRRHDGEV